jgi:hypothetical protein
MSLSIPRRVLTHLPQGYPDLSRTRLDQMAWSCIIGSKPAQIPTQVHTCYPLMCIADPIQEYPFAKYHVPTTDYTFSQDEYTRFLEGMFGHCHHIDQALTMLNRQRMDERRDRLPL